MYRVAWINICLLTRMEETFIRNQPNPQGPDERSDLKPPPMPLP